MNVLVLVAAIMAGRALSLAVYQATWRNGLDRSFRRGGALVTFLMRPRWWPLHLLWCLALPHADRESLPTVKPWAIAACVTLALSAVGRLGAVDLNRFFLMDRVCFRGFSGIDRTIFRSTPTCAAGARAVGDAGLCLLSRLC